MPSAWIVRSERVCLIFAQPGLQAGDWLVAGVQKHTGHTPRTCQSSWDRCVTCLVEHRPVQRCRFRGSSCGRVSGQPMRLNYWSLEGTKQCATAISTARSRLGLPGGASVRWRHGVPRSGSDDGVPTPLIRRAPVKRFAALAAACAIRLLSARRKQSDALIAADGGWHNPTLGKVTK